MKCWHSGFNEQGLRVIIVVVQVGAVKKQCRRSGEKETQDETQFSTEIRGKTSLGPSYFIL
jgi:hypothetical protein